MLSEGIIRPSNNIFSSQILLVKKKDGSWRFYVNYRALNEATMKDRFLIPTVQELFDEHGGALVFSKLDHHVGFYSSCSLGYPTLCQHSKRSWTPYFDRYYANMFSYFLIIYSFIVPLGMPTSSTYDQSSQILSPTSWQPRCRSTNSDKMKSAILVIESQVKVFLCTPRRSLLSVTGRYEALSKYCEASWGT